MATKNLIGSDIELIVSDPWEFCSVHGTGPFLAKVTKVGRDSQIPTKEAIQIRFSTPLPYKGMLCEYFITSPRLESGDLGDLVYDREVFCSLTAISADRANSPDPFDLSWWRGGIGLIGTMRRR